MSNENSLKFLLSFKREERYIYDEIQRHSGKGNWIKDILKEHVPVPEKCQEKGPVA